MLHVWIALVKGSADNVTPLDTSSGIPVKYSDTQPSIRQAPPVLGQHTDSVLRDELGYDKTLVDEVRRAGAIL